jgi:hypothetical protein
MLRSGNTGSYGSSGFSFWKYLHTTFHNGCANFHSHQQCIWPILPHPCQNLFLLFPLDMAILIEVGWNLKVVLICISFIATEVEHFFLYLQAICTSSFETFLFNSCPFLHWDVDSLGVEFFWVPCRFWILVPYRMNSWQRFSLILWTVSWV